MVDSTRLEGRTWRTIRYLAVAALVGLVGGAVAALGARIAMRIVSLMEPAAQGLVTDNGNVIGEITLKGTADLILAGAFFFGLPAGLVWLPARRFFRGDGWRTALLTGGWLLVTFASAVIDPDNADFVVFGEPIVNVVMFSLLFFVFALVAEPLGPALEARTTPPRPRGSLRFLALAGMTTLALLSLLLIISAVATVALGGEDTSTTDRLMSLLAVIVMIGLPLGPVRIPRLIALGVPALLGGALTISTLSTVLS